MEKTVIVGWSIFTVIIVSIISLYPLLNKDNVKYDDIGNVSANTSLDNIYELANCSNNFAFEMYRELLNGSDNVFFSPYSITTALGMAYEGAKGQTASEMAQVLNLPTGDQTRWDLIKAFQSQFNKKSESYNLSTANAYWLRQNEKLNEVYRNVIESYYLAHGEQLDFAGDPVGSAETINNWIEQETNGRIKDLIPPEIITPWVYLILTNAIYFKSDWKYQFNSNATINQTFYLSGEEIIDTEMMHMNDESILFNYSSNDEVQLLQLPYKNREISMYIMLPKAKDITSLDSNLDYDYLYTLKEDMSSKYIDLYLPKFKFEQKYKLKDILCDMGMPTAFGGSADFSGISADSRPLKISKVLHQSFVEVNEEGTEAAAATAVILVDYTSSDPSPVPIEFRADHPFIFFIEHEGTGQILFMGKVENPSA